MLIDIHTHNPKTAEGILSIRSFCISSNTDTHQQPFSIGLHPWNTPQDNWIDHLKEIAAQPACIMIGECGLDKLRGDNLKLQEERFIQQIDLSEELRKPIVAHCVKAYNELIEIRIRKQPAQPWILHGFRGSPQLAQTLLSHGIIPSFGDSLHIPKQAETLKAIGLGHFFLETDESSIQISDLYTHAAEIFGISKEDLIITIEDLYYSTQRRN